MRKTSLVAVGIAVLVLAFAVAACGGDDESTDDTPPAAEGSDVVSSAPIGASAENPDEILDYWTPEREAEAIPLDIVRDGDPPESQGGPQAGPSDTPDAEGPQGSSDGAVTPEGRAAGSASADELGEPGIAAATPNSPNWLRYTGRTTKLPFRHVGVLFFVNPSDGRDYTCSAAVVSAPNRSTVWTAGHCVHNGKDAWMTKVKFVPGYQGGKKPYGEWPVKMQPGPLLYSTGGWTSGADFDYDFGAVVVAPRGGKRLENVIGGGQGLLWNPNRVPALVDFGYPANPSPPFEFQKGPYGCGSKIVVRDRGEPRPFGIDCYFGEGASGGPWIIDYRPKRGWGYITSVNSYGYPSARGLYFGPYPGNAVPNVFNAAKGS